MVDDIRLQLSFKNHRKRRKLNALLSLQPSGTDYLLDLWLSTAQNHPEGKLKGMDELDIALEAGWNGDPKQFVEALMEARLLEKNGECFLLHDWAENQPWVFYSKKRSKIAKNNALKRHKNQRVAATGKPTASQRLANGSAPSPSPSPSPNVYIKNIYTYYCDKILPIRKSKQRALSNIESHLKRYSEDSLKVAVDNYSQIALSSEPEFRKDPANFFGKNEPYFKDYLPENFEPPKEEHDGYEHLFAADETTR